MTNPRQFASRDALEARAALAVGVGQDLAAAGFTVAVRFGAEPVPPFTRDDSDRVDRDGGCDVYFDRGEDGGVCVYVTWQPSRSLEDRARTAQAVAHGTQDAATPTTAVAYAHSVPQIMAPALAQILRAAGYEVDHDPDDDYDPDLLTVTAPSEAQVRGPQRVS